MSASQKDRPIKIGFVPPTVIIREKMQWISIKDKVPLLHQDVLVTDGKQIWYAWRDTMDGEDLEFARYGYDDFDSEEVTHWMPFPSIDSIPK